MTCNTAMISVRLFFLLIGLALLTMSQASAATYNLNPPNRPALCSGNQGTWSGNTYTCTWDQPFSLQQGDVITSSAAVTIHSNSGMNLTNVTLGNSSNPITLTAESGRTIQLNNSVLYSSIGGGSTQDVVLTNNTIVHGSISVSGTIQSTNSTVMGNIASSSGAIQSTNSIVMGTITSSNGAVTFTGGQAFGHINVQCCKVTVSGGAVIHAGIRAGNNGIDISNSTVTGDLNAGSNPIVLTNVTMLSGNISAGSNDVTINGGDITANVTNANNVRISNGAVVHGKVQARYLVDANNSTIYGDIETTDNFPEGLHHVKLTDSTVYGNVTVRTDWGTIIGNWPDSAIYGDCDYQSVTPSLCQAGPPPISDPLWKFDEAQWNGNANEVIDSSVNLRHGIALNGANTAISNPSPASCTYGDFQRGSSSSNNPYVGIGRNSYFHSADNFSFSLWIRMNGADLPGTRQVILAYGADNGVNDEVYGRFELLRTSAGALRFAVRMENKNLRYVETTGNVFNGQWHHVAVSYSKTNRRMRLYVDNVLLDDVPDEPIGNSNPFNTPNDGNKGLSIGALPNGSNGIKGQIDEVRFLNFELTAAQVAAYAAETASCAVPDQCFIENFGSTTNWYPTTLNNSTAPSLQSSPSRLRLTTNAQNQSTAITFKRSFPALGNKMTIEFDYYGFGGSGADGVALVLSDATVTPSPGSYGGSLGYAQRNNGNSGFAGGWLGIGFDEFGNYQLPAEGRVGGRTTGNNTNWRDSVGIRASASKSYKWLAGTNTLSPGIDTGNNTLGPGHRYRITVDSRITSPSQQVLFKLERRTSSTGSYSTLIDTLNLMAQDQSAPPANLLLSYTGSTGDNTNFHDITNIQVCTQQPSTPIELGSQLHHIEFSYPASPLTCNPTEVTIKACANASCTELYTSPVTLTLAAVGGSWSGTNPFTFTGSTTKNLIKTTAGSFTLAVTSSSVTPTNTVQCLQGGAADDCIFTVADSGFVFNVQDMIANQSQNVVISAVRKDNASQQCVPAFASVPKQVKLWSDYINPVASGRPVSRSVSLDTVDIAQSEVAAQSRTLNFNSSGQATVSLNYIDAGQMRLNARYEGSGADAGLVMTGSDQFIARPAGICISAEQHCAAGDNSCSLFKKAGETFTLGMIAKAWQQDNDTNLCDNGANINTPNFELSNIVINHQLVAPALADGGSLGILSALSYNHARATNATTNVTQTVSEVGVFRFGAVPPVNQYMGYTIPSTISLPVGRFIPAYFAATPGPAEILALDECTNFHYLGQDMEYETNPSVVYEARNVQGNATQNYAHSFFRADNWAGAATATKTSYSDAAVSLSSPVAVSRGNFALSNQTNGYDGKFSLTLSGDVLSYLRPVEPDYPAPFVPQLKLNLLAGQWADQDGVCVKTSDVGSCQPVEVGITAPTQKYGRLVIKGGNVADASAPASTLVPLEFRTEFWSGTAFVVNTDDSCTVIDPASVSFTTVGLGVAGSSYPLSSGLTGATSLSATIPGGSTGVWPVFYAAPDWLKYNWLEESGTQVADNPFSEVSVGRYRGNKRQIFWQERLN
jgi:MSHA biogenesis protein MshQ